MTRQHALTEQVLNEIGDAESGGERVSLAGEAQIVSEHALPHEPEDPAEENAGSDECREACSRRSRRRNWRNDRLGHVAIGAALWSGTPATPLDGCSSDAA